MVCRITFIFIHIKLRAASDIRVIFFKITLYNKLHILTFNRRENNIFDSVLAILFCVAHIAVSDLCPCVVVIRYINLIGCNYTIYAARAVVLYTRCIAYAGNALFFTHIYGKIHRVCFGIIICPVCPA